MKLLAVHTALQSGHRPSSSPYLRSQTRLGTRSQHSACCRPLAHLSPTPLGWRAALHITQPANSVTRYMPCPLLLPPSPTDSRHKCFTQGMVIPPKPGLPRILSPHHTSQCALPAPCLLLLLPPCPPLHPPLPYQTCLQGNSGHTMCQYICKTVTGHPLSATPQPPPPSSQTPPPAHLTDRPRSSSGACSPSHAASTSSLTTACSSPSGSSWSSRSLSTPSTESPTDLAHQEAAPSLLTPQPLLPPPPLNAFSASGHPPFHPPTHRPTDIPNQMPAPFQMLTHPHHCLLSPLAHTPFAVGWCLCCPANLV